MNVIPTFDKNCISECPFPDDDPYIQWLRNNADKKFYVKPIQGNSGDSLIYYGTKNLLNQLRVPATIDPGEADFILSPGGNPSMWGAHLGEWRQVLKAFPDARLVIGPATFQESQVRWQAGIEAIADRCVAIFARDVGSYRNLTKAGFIAAVTLGLSHDPALSLVHSEWMLEQRAASRRDHVLISLRDDHESRFRGLPLPASLKGGKLLRLLDRVMIRRQTQQVACGIEAALDGACPVRKLDASVQNFEFFVELVRRAAEVHTDRLHVAILAAMLGKRVTAYTTSYGKLEAVWEHSQALLAPVHFVTEAH